ncbi:MAG: hypothetical protein J2P54_13375 [Bradyrhizobiaceae bacterium]|nr:hypothetical protein [Bradyrhizobiaceae bacterium]
MRRPIIEKFREDHGGKRFALLHAIAIRNILDKKSPVAQRNFRKAIRGLVKWAVTKGLIDVDPFATVALANVQRRGKFTGIIPWKDEECEQFERFYPLGRGSGWLTSCFCKRGSLCAM